MDSPSTDDVLHELDNIQKKMEIELNDHIISSLEFRENMHSINDMKDDIMSQSQQGGKKKPKKKPKKKTKKKTKKSKSEKRKSKSEKRKSTSEKRKSTSEKRKSTSEKRKSNSITEKSYFNKKSQPHIETELTVKPDGKIQIKEKYSKLFIKGMVFLILAILIVSFKGTIFDSLDDIQYYAIQHIKHTINGYARCTHPSLLHFTHITIPMNDCDVIIAITALLRIMFECKILFACMFGWSTWKYPQFTIVPLYSLLPLSIQATKNTLVMINEIRKMMCDQFNNAIDIIQSQMNIM